MAKSFFWAASDDSGVNYQDGNTGYTPMFSELVRNVTTEAQSNTPLRRNAGIVSDLKVYASVNTTLVDTVITVRNSAADTTLTVTYTSGQTGEKEDTINSFSATTSDELDYKIAVANDASGSTIITINNIYTTIESPGNISASMGHVGGITGGFTAPSGAWYISGGNSCEGLATVQTTETLTALTVNATFNTSNLYGYVTTNTKTTTTSIRVRKNTANGNQLIQWTSGQTGAKEDITNSDSFVATDTYAMVLTTGAEAINTITFSTFCVSIDNDEGVLSYFLAINNGSNNGCTTTVYAGLSGRPQDLAWGETVNRSKIGFDCNVTNLHTYVSINSSSLASTLQFRVNGATSTLSVSYAAGETGAKSDTDVVAIVGETDYINFQDVQGGSGTMVVQHHYVDLYTTKIWLPDIRMLMEG